MKKIITTSLLTLFGIPLGLLIISDVTGIGKKEEGFKVYNAYSSTKEGQDLIKKYNIKCIAKDVESIAFIDMSRGETFFAYNIDHNNYYFYENIKYEKVSENVIKQYKLVTHFSWLNTYGRWIFYGVGIICLIALLFKL